MAAGSASRRTRNQVIKLSYSRNASDGTKILQKNKILRYCNATLYRSQSVPLRFGGEHNKDFLALPVHEQECIALRLIGQGRDIAQGTHLVPIHFFNDVALNQPGLRRRGIRFDVAHDDALRFVGKNHGLSPQIRQF